MVGFQLSRAGECRQRGSECTLAHEQKPPALRRRRRRNGSGSWGLTQLSGALGWQFSEREYLWEI